MKTKTPGGLVGLGCVAFTAFVIVRRDAVARRRLSVAQSRGGVGGSCIPLLRARLRTTPPASQATGRRAAPAGIRGEVWRTAGPQASRRDLCGVVLPVQLAMCITILAVNNKQLYDVDTWCAAFLRNAFFWGAAGLRPARHGARPASPPRAPPQPAGPTTRCVPRVAAGASGTTGEHHRSWAVTGSGSGNCEGGLCVCFVHSSAWRWAVGRPPCGKHAARGAPCHAVPTHHCERRYTQCVSVSHTCWASDSPLDDMTPCQ